MNKYTRRIIDYFSKENVVYYLDDDNEIEDDQLTVPVYLSGLPSIIIRVFVTDYGKCTFMTKLGAAKEESTVNRLYPILNKMNSKYSFVSLYVNERNSVVLNSNFMISTRTQFNIIDEYFRAMISIGSEACKEILPELWDMCIVEKDSEAEEVFDPEETYEWDDQDILEDESDWDDQETSDDGSDWDDQGILDEESDWTVDEPFFDEDASFLFSGENTDSESPDEELVEESDEDDEIQFNELFSVEDSDDESDSSDDESIAS